MAGKTREIKSRMKAVGNIQRITRTMQMIATARYQATQRRATQAQPYTDKIAEVMRELAASGAEVAHPLLSPPERSPNRELLLVITSNRGLAGAYNANVLRTANKYLRQQEAEVDLEVVGKKGLAFFQFADREISKRHTHFGDEPAYDEVERLADRYISDFTAGGYDAVRVAYVAFHSASNQTPELIQLLPTESPEGQGEGEGRQAGTGEAGGGSHGGGEGGASGGEGGSGGGGSGGYEFSPSAEELLDELLPMAVKTRLFQCFNEAVVSEQLARMVAMKAATDSAGKMKKNLGRRYNRARQAAITTELSEIIGGAAALE